MAYLTRLTNTCKQRLREKRCLTRIIALGVLRQSFFQFETVADMHYLVPSYRHQQNARNIFLAPKIQQPYRILMLGHAALREYALDAFRLHLAF